MILRIRASVVVPAHNEVQGVAGVVAACIACPDIAETIVVDDGSSDGTGDVAREAGAFVVELRPNRGKAFAMDAGLERAASRIVLFLDSDLRGLHAEHLSALVRPVCEGRYHVVVGTVGRGAPDRRTQDHPLPLLAGQRCFHRYLWPAMMMTYPKVRDLRFGIEMGLNWMCSHFRLRTTTIHLKGVWDPFKCDKFGKDAGTFRRLQMWTEIARTTAYLSKNTPAWRFNLAYLDPAG